MSVRDEIEYIQISQDWRHRDNLTWQLPSLIVAIGGAVIAAAFTLDMTPLIKAVLLGFGAFLSLCLNFALKENLHYQVGSGEALTKIVKGEKIPENVPRRIIKPEDLGIKNWKKELVRKHRLTGSYYLLNFCIIITIILFGLVVSSIAECLILW